MCQLKFDHNNLSDPITPWSRLDLLLTVDLNNIRSTKAAQLKTYSLRLK